MITSKQWEHRGGAKTHHPVHRLRPMHQQTKRPAHLLKETRRSMSGKRDLNPRPPPWQGRRGPRRNRILPESGEQRRAGRAGTSTASTGIPSGSTSGFQPMRSGRCEAGPRSSGDVAPDLRDGSREPSGAGSQQWPGHRRSLAKIGALGPPSRPTPCMERPHVRSGRRAANAFSTSRRAGAPR